MMGNYYLAFKTGDRLVTFDLTGRTKAECEQSLRWQMRDPDAYAIVRPATFRGTFVLPDGSIRAIDRGFWADAAWQAFLTGIWGKESE